MVRPPNRSSPTCRRTCNGFSPSSSRCCAAAAIAGADGPDLTLAQLSVLLTLLDQGPIRMTELAARERVRTPTTTVAIRRLEKLGLVKRSRDPSDLRAVPGRGDPRGLLRHREALAVRRANLESMLGKLTDEERDTPGQALAPLERLATRSKTSD